MEKTSIIIVDDHQLIIDGLVRMVSADDRFEVVATYNSPEEALKKVPILQPDILMTDLEMPGMNGLELIRKIRDWNSGQKVILLTMHLDRATVKSAMERDVNAYLLKNLDEREFLMALNKVRQGQRYFSYEVTDTLANKDIEIKPKAQLKTLGLTDREREILTLIAEGLSSKMIADDLSISLSTVETHRKALIKKLEVSNVAGLVRIAVQEGLV